MFASWMTTPSTASATNDSGMSTSTASMSIVKSTDEDEDVHRRKMTAILRYIASMHSTVNEQDAAACSFVKTGVAPHDEASAFFQREQEDRDGVGGGGGGGVLFSTDNFRMLLSMEAQHGLFPSPPFSFYAAAASVASTNNRNKKRTLAGTIKNSLSSSSSSPFSNNNNNNNNSNPPEKACWLRITRLTNAQIAKPPIAQHPELKLYLNHWLERTPRVHTLERLLGSQRRLEHAPKVPPTITSRGLREIKTFLRQHKKYLKRKAYQRELEPIYNRLFEWIQKNHQHQQNSHYEELVWGLGHARRYSTADGGTLVNGPVLEILVEVALARDGALLVRPREHTGVSLCRSVAVALANGSGSEAAAAGGQAVLQQLYRTVAELEASQLSPGQPSTYVPLMKRLAVELSSGGRFQPSSASSSSSSSNQLVVTEGWCLYARPKPSSVWARDATAFADQLLSSSSSSSSSTSGNFVLPRAAWALTHGPGGLGRRSSGSCTTQNGTDNHGDNLVGGVLGWLSSRFAAQSKTDAEFDVTKTKPLFPLAASDAQYRIAHLLLDREFPAVVCEGPPGTGKTQTIANTICAYLCRGKRVLVTSKNAPALSVLRKRLPAAVQELVVDVSMSELNGMRQLQQTVERLANRVASANSDAETQKHIYLQQTIDEHERELARIDSRIRELNDSIRHTVRHPEGQEMIELSIELIDSVPWLMKTISEWSPQQVVSLRDRVERLVLENGDPALGVSGFEKPPSDALVSAVAGLAGKAVSAVANAARKAVAALPIVGSLSGMSHQQVALQQSLEQLTVNGETPASPKDWAIVLSALTRSQDVEAFQQQELKAFERKYDWPGKELLASNEQIQKFVSNLDKAVRTKEIAWKHNVADKISIAAECRALDAKRSLLSSRAQSLAEELVDASVVAELSRSFSMEAQSALIRFAQIAGKAKFSKSSQPSKMSQRQRRRRLEYLDAFDKCCRFIPCWIATQSQISDYLPSEVLFDLVVTDESSQSDVTILPGMLRGRQWLIVGDGKQVSPTDNFISEEQVDSLKAALPELGPLEDSLLPGQSFFDLCSQAFPNGRVVLSEHFRCASEIIEFSNRQFYDGQLVPLRLPMKSERISPSIVDIRLPDGVKAGKVNEKEADEIVRRIEEIVSHSDSYHRSIGVISLMGDEQSRLIRGRLLDAIGPHQFARHNILIGDASTFQGAERDIVILSMVCSPRSAPTQSQLMHFQRANVALSRARDQLILVRSLDISDIPNNDDIKIPIIEFFTASGETGNAAGMPKVESTDTIHHQHTTARQLLTKLLTHAGYTVRSMGVIWKNGLCIEHPTSDLRAALMIDGAEASVQEWQASYSQQKAIERVGWKCARIDILSFLSDFCGTLESIRRFLSSAGVEPPQILYDELDEVYGEPAEDGTGGQAPMNVDDAVNGAPAENDEDAAEDNVEQEADPEGGQQQRGDEAEAGVVRDEDVIVISSEDEDEGDLDSKPRAKVKPEPVASGSFGDDSGDDMDESNFGNVVDLAFLRNDRQVSAAALDDSESGDAGEIDESASQRATARRRRRRRLDKYQRDGRWYPVRDGDEDEDDDPEGHVKDWYDEDSAEAVGQSEKRRRSEAAASSAENNEMPESD